MFCLFISFQLLFVGKRNCYYYDTALFVLGIANT